MTRRRLPWLDTRPLPEALLDQAPFDAALATYAEQHGESPAAVRAEAGPYLDQMLASHREGVASAWTRFGKWMLRAHDVIVDEEQVLALRQLDRTHSLAFVFSHRSYLDGLVLPLALEGRRFGPTYTVGGANLDLPVMGQLASQNGTIFIRRSTRDAPLYRVVLRSYVAYLAGRGENLAWSIEGGRTRTGKLRPPTQGLLHYLALAVDDDPRADVAVVPVSIVYDQLHEVARMTWEAKGSAKRPEDLRWLVSLAKSQQQRLGRAYVTFGTPIPLRERLEELRREGVGESGLIERIAVDASHRINRATPVTVTAVVCLALLGADRALTFDELLVTVEPVATYLAARSWPVAGGASLTDRSTLRRALHELVTSGVLSCYDGGTEPVWQVAEHQHLVAAFYRNTMIHFLVGRAIGELGLLEAAQAATGAGATPGGDETGALTQVGWRHALALRDLLKFEFFFPARPEFQHELREELSSVVPGVPVEKAVARADEVLRDAPLYVAHLVLRPFIDAYLLLADRLVARGDADVGETARQALLDEALRLGEQWVRQRRIASAESVSLELLRTALKLAEHRGLLGGAGPSETAAARVAFLDEVVRVRDGLAEIAALAHNRHAQVAAEATGAAGGTR